MTVTKIKMRKGKNFSKNPLDIEGIYVDGKYITIESMYDYLKTTEEEINLAGFNNVHLVRVLSSDGRKYLRSEPSVTFIDNLLKLPRV